MSIERMVAITSLLLSLLCGVYSFGVLAEKVAVLEKQAVNNIAVLERLTAIETTLKFMVNGSRKVAKYRE